jgi:4-diphosphocytidyl-2-C-methyl-D-erythritol kinase
MLMDDLGLGGFAVQIEITKRIPLAAGLAGGSADAAAALVAFARALADTGLELHEEQLYSVARRLGSDVAFSLLVTVTNRSVTAARGTHFGEIITAIPGYPEQNIRLITQPYGLSTPAVYREYDRLNSAAPSAPNALRNALQSAAISLRPELQQVIDSNTDDTHVAIISGSGPTVAVIEVAR